MPLDFFPYNFSRIEVEICCPPLKLCSVWQFEQLGWFQPYSDQDMWRNNIFSKPFHQDAEKCPTTWATMFWHLNNLPIALSMRKKMRISWWKQIKWGYSTFNSDSTFISLYLLLSDMECSIKEGRGLARQASQWTVPLNKKVSNVKKNLSLWHCFWRSVFSHLIMEKMSRDNGTLDSHSEILVRMAWTCSWILESW